MITLMGIYSYDPTIFDDFTVFCPEGVDPQTLADTILFQNAELDLLYSDPVIMKGMIRLWAKASQYSWSKLAATLSLEYNPIWNKDGTITETETSQGSGTGIEQVAAFNSSDFENRSKDTTEATGSRAYTRVEQGNIGVTSTQQLIKEEREIAMYNIYDAISNDFRQRFCLQVY